MVYVHAVELSTGSHGAFAGDVGITRSLNDSLGLILRSYTRAINKQENRSGSLFKTHTKAECLNDITKISSMLVNSMMNELENQQITAEEYPQICFNYIHDNPVKAKLVRHPADWEYSSYMDFCGLRNGKLINRERAIAFGLQLKKPV
jgi:putative transposase